MNERKIPRMIRWVNTELFGNKDFRRPTTSEADQVKARVAALNAAYKGKLTSDVRVRHGETAWLERGVVFQAEDRKPQHG